MTGITWITVRWQDGTEGVRNSAESTEIEVVWSHEENKWWGTEKSCWSGCGKVQSTGQPKHDMERVC